MVIRCKIESCRKAITPADNGFAGFDIRQVVQQKNLHNRVSFVQFADTANGSSFNQATYYTYDIRSNVDTLLQDYGVTS